MIRQFCVKFSAFVVTLVLCGCLGTTEDASHITATGAKLKATGTCHSGTCDLYFKYWPADSNPEWGYSTPVERTPTLPPGTTGPYHTEVTGLQPDTEYEFQVCGKEAADPEFDCSNVKSFRTAPDQIPSFGATLSDPNLVTLTWTTTGGSPGEPIHIYGVYTDTAGNTHRNVGFRTDHNNTQGLTFRVPPGTHRYVLELPIPGGGKVQRTAQLTVPFPNPPVVTFTSEPLFQLGLANTTVSWQPIPQGQYLSIRPQGKDPIKITQSGQTSHTFTAEFLQTLGQGQTIVSYLACIDMEDLPYKMNGDYCSYPSRADIFIGSARFNGPQRHFVSTGSSLTVTWTATGESTVLSTPDILDGEQILEGVNSYAFNDLPPGIHDISLDSCTSGAADCVNTEPVKSPVAGTVTDVPDRTILEELISFFVIGANQGQVLGKIKPEIGPEVDIPAPVKGTIVKSLVEVGDQVSADDILFLQQTATPPYIQIVVSETPFIRRPWSEDFSIYYSTRHDLPDTSHVKLGATMPLLVAEDNSIWTAGEFAEGSITHITAEGGNFRISPLAAPLLNVPSQGNQRLVPVKPFDQPKLSNASLTKQETLVEAGQYIWFVNGGSSHAAPGQNDNWNRIIRFDRAGTDLSATIHDDRFCVYHIPTNNAGITGMDWDEDRNRVWYVESRYVLPNALPVLAWFNPDELNCENLINYDDPVEVGQSSTKYCLSPSQSDCIHTEELDDWDDSTRKLLGAGFVKVDSDAVWVAGYLSNNIARYDINLERVDIINTNPPNNPTKLMAGSGPWMFLPVEDDLYFTEFFDGDVVKLDKQALAADTTGACKDPGTGNDNPCMSEIHVTEYIKDIARHGNRLYFAGYSEFGYINLDTWTPGKIYTGLEQRRNPDRSRGVPLLSGDMSIGPNGMLVINDYTGRSVLRFYPINP